MAPRVTSSGARVVDRVWTREPEEKSPASTVRASGWSARSRSSAEARRAKPPRSSPPSWTLGKKQEWRSWVKSTVASPADCPSAAQIFSGSRPNKSTAVSRILKKWSLCLMPPLLAPTVLWFQGLFCHKSCKCARGDCRTDQNTFKIPAREAVFSAPRAQNSQLLADLPQSVFLQAGHLGLGDADLLRHLHLGLALVEAHG